MPTSLEDAASMYGFYRSDRKFSLTCFSSATSSAIELTLIRDTGSCLSSVYKMMELGEGLHLFCSSSDRLGKNCLNEC